jgi:hypothetical protein
MVTDAATCRLITYKRFQPTPTGHRSPVRDHYFYDENGKLIRKDIESNSSDVVYSDKMFKYTGNPPSYWVPLEEGDK